MEETLFSFEDRGTRQEVAATLRGVATRLSGTGPITLSAGEQTVTVHPSESLDLEVELERELEDGEGYLELEVEVGWREAETASDDSETAPESAEGGAPSQEPAGADEGSESGAEPADAVDLEAGEAPDERPAAVRSQATFEVFRDRADEWRWRLVHRNGNVIATSGEGYTTRRNAEKGLRSVVRNAPGADVVDDL